MISHFTRHMTRAAIVAFTINVLLHIALAVAVANAGDTYDIVMKAGEDYRRTHTWTTKTGQPVNLTGNSYVSQFRSAPWPEGTVYANFSAVVVNAAAGQIRHSLSRRQSVILSKKTGVWDIRQTDAAGLVSYRYGGTVKVLPPATAPAP